MSIERFREIEARSLALPAIPGGFELAGAIEWQEGVQPPANADVFAREAIFVICNSGMKHTVARGIFDRVMEALGRGGSASNGFAHPGKATAIDWIWSKRGELFAGFSALRSDTERLDWLGQLPWIGSITKYHLAKNFGVDVAKPDVHLQRLAEADGSSVEAMCSRLARQSGYRIATVDLILWFACARGIIDSRALAGRRGAA